MTRHHSNERRAAFTLVEMLVASALILFMMWIIASAFEKALTSFRVLKTAGDMQEKLRAAATAIRRDLTRPHFNTEGADDEDLGNQRLDLTGWTPPQNGYFRIYQQADATGTSGDVDGGDSDDLTLIHRRSPKASELIGHVLQFTARIKGIRRDQYYSVDTHDLNGDLVLSNPAGAGDGLLQRFNFPAYNRRVVYPIMGAGGSGSYPSDPNPSSLFTTTWAEVTYFVRPNGDSAGPNTPLYSLYRRQTLLVKDLPETVSYTTGSRPLEIPSAFDPRYLEVSAWRKGGTNPVNGQAMVTAPCRRFGVNPGSQAGVYSSPIPTMTDQVGGNINDPLAATDLMMTNVTGFTVRAMWDGGATATLPANPDYPFDVVPPSTVNTTFGSDRVFDTWSQRIPPSGGFDDYGSPIGTPAWNGGYPGGGPASAKSIPLKIRVRAIQIELRIWDQKSQQSRQITIIQDV